jgi:hypothetical protein
MEKLRACVGRIKHGYEASPVTSGGWVELVAALESDVRALEIFDSSGEVMDIGMGPAGSEVVLFQVPRGGNTPQLVPQLLNAGMRLVVRAQAETAAVGELLINLYR